MFPIAPPRGRYLQMTGVVRASFSYFPLEIVIDAAEKLLVKNFSKIQIDK